MNEPRKSIASLIYWKDGVDKERIERWLKALAEKDVILAEVTREYNPEIGCPVWYVP